MKEYFILDPKDRHLQVYRLGVAGSFEEIEPDEKGVIRSHVLPGFQFRREYLLREPKLVELARDNVYADNVYATMSFPNCWLPRPEPKRQKNAPTPQRPPGVLPKKRPKH